MSIVTMVIELYDFKWKKGHDHNVKKFFELKKGHIGIVEKAQETSSDSDMHNTVCLCHCSTS